MTGWGGGERKRGGCRVAGRRGDGVAEGHEEEHEHDAKGSVRVPRGVVGSSGGGRGVHGALGRRVGLAALPARLQYIKTVRNQRDGDSGR